MDRKERRSPNQRGKAKKGPSIKGKRNQEKHECWELTPNQNNTTTPTKVWYPPPKNKSTTKGKDRKKEFERKTNEQREKKTNNTNNKKKQTTKPTKQKTKRKQTRNKKQSHKRIKNVKRHPVSLPKFIYSLSVNHPPNFPLSPLVPKEFFFFLSIDKNAQLASMDCSFLKKGSLSFIWLVIVWFCFDVFFVVLLI